MADSELAALGEADHRDALGDTAAAVPPSDAFDAAPPDSTNHVGRD